jgi:hypothetical protein
MLRGWDGEDIVKRRRTEESIWGTFNIVQFVLVPDIARGNLRCRLNNASESKGGNSRFSIPVGGHTLIKPTIDVFYTCHLIIVNLWKII